MRQRCGCRAEGRGEQAPPRRATSPPQTACGTTLWCPSADVPRRGGIAAARAAAIGLRACDDRVSGVFSDLQCPHRSVRAVEWKASESV
mmetsp:Transcript_36405/g.100464  ORF Transcript_36405/g.100464 Transcript_36405/m.100464 type:complete len:89 (+) Transcript_36405:331-597(+)